MFVSIQWEELGTGAFSAFPKRHVYKLLRTADTQFMYIYIYMYTSRPFSTWTLLNLQHLLYRHTLAYDTEWKYIYCVCCSLSDSISFLLFPFSSLIIISFISHVRKISHWHDSEIRKESRCVYLCACVCVCRVCLERAVCLSETVIRMIRN